MLICILSIYVHTHICAYTCVTYIHIHIRVYISQRWVKKRKREERWKKKLARLFSTHVYHITNNKVKIIRENRLNLTINRAIIIRYHIKKTELLKLKELKCYTLYLEWLKFKIDRLDNRSSILTSNYIFLRDIFLPPSPTS